MPILYLGQLFGVYYRAGRYICECGLINPECGRIIRKCGRINPECGRIIRKCGRINPECGRIIRNCGRIIYFSTNNLKNAIYKIPFRI